MCDEWKDDFPAFMEWAIKNNYEEGLTLDRIDNEKGYSPDNCRWATVLEQNNNKRTNKVVTYQGETHTLSEWCRILNLNYNTVKSRFLTTSWDTDEILSTPTGSRTKEKADNKHKISKPNTRVTTKPFYRTPFAL